MFQTLGPLELLIILLIVIALFGAGRIAGVGRALGTSVREFRSEARSGRDGGEEEDGEGEDGEDEAEGTEPAADTMASADASSEGSSETPAEKKSES